MTYNGKPKPKQTNQQPDTDKPILSVPISDEQWQAIANNDTSYDGQFFYAVKTTGIFCRPSCRSKVPNRENIGFFENADQALAAHFRPCKRCKPTEQRLPDEEWIDYITEYVGSHFDETLTLEVLALMSHGTPYHLHRTFKKIKGMTPLDYIQHVRMEKAKMLLTTFIDPVTEVGESVGLPNTSYFITLFKKKTGQTPEAYRRQQKDQLKEVCSNGI